ncbi:MAG: GtrA family protein [Eubacteriales bacterium]
MKTIIQSYYVKYEAIILYLFWGVMATLLNIVLYEIFANVMGIHYVVANAIDWVLCVAFAYMTNRTFVFKSQVKGFRGIGAEISKFVSCRIISGAMDMGIMILMVSFLHIDDSIAKIVTQFVVVISNYIFSKLFIFKNKESAD